MNKKSKINVLNQAFSILLVGCFFLVPSYVYAGCKDDNQRTDECSAEECAARYSKVHSTCDVPRSCGKKMNKEILQTRLDANRACLEVRNRVAECFLKVDAVHTEQIGYVENAIGKCERFLNK